jgi:hypothetical protein
MPDDSAKETNEKCGALLSVKIIPRSLVAIIAPRNNFDLLLFGQCLFRSKDTWMPSASVAPREEQFVQIVPDSSHCEHI